VGSWGKGSDCRREEGKSVDPGVDSLGTGTSVPNALRDPFKSKVKGADRWKEGRKRGSGVVAGRRKTSLHTSILGIAKTGKFSELEAR